MQNFSNYSGIGSSSYGAELIYGIFKTNVCIYLHSYWVCLKQIATEYFYQIIQTQTKKNILQFEEINRGNIKWNCEVNIKFYRCIFLQFSVKSSCISWLWIFQFIPHSNTSIYSKILFNHSKFESTKNDSTSNRVSVLYLEKRTHFFLLHTTKVCHCVSVRIDFTMT